MVVTSVGIIVLKENSVDIGVFQGVVTASVTSSIVRDYGGGWLEELSLWPRV